MRFFDFFAGIGGFRLGMEMAGHECVGHCEIDKYANTSYMAMHKPKETEVQFGDIRTVDSRDMPECDIYCGGFPCQPFSIAGMHGGFEDTRGTLFFEIMRLAKERHPRFIFLENVRGLLNHEGGDTFETIITTMVDVGYDVEWQVLDSRSFTNQHRERLFIVGHLRGERTEQVFPIAVNESLSQGSNSKAFINTIVARYPGNLSGTYIDTGGDRIRSLTPRECFRLQGFPDEYFERASQVCSERQLYKQAGNSVTVPVIYEIARRLK